MSIRWRAARRGYVGQRGSAKCAALSPIDVAHEGNAMRFMIIVKATALSESGAMPEKKIMATMATYHEELVKAGVLLDATGLQPSSKGWKVRFKGGKRTIIDGPF